MVVIAERKKPKSAEAHEAHVQASAMVEEQYQNFDVVWAKMSSFAWWPAVLFYSWDAVNQAGLDLKQVQSQLVIPPPTMKALPDGKERLVYSVLIMYLDKFNCSVVEVSPKTVCPFAINYERLHKPKKKSKSSSGFNIALKRALRLLHMNDHMTVEELDAVAPVRYLPAEEELGAEQSKAGKRQKKSHPHRKEVDVHEFEEEEEHEDDGSDYTDGEGRGGAGSRQAKLSKKDRALALKVGAPKKIVSATASPYHTIDLSAAAKKAPSKRTKPGFRYVEAIDGDEDESDFEIVNTGFFDAPGKVTTSGKKASRKAGRVHHDIIDVDNNDGVDSDDFQIAVVNHEQKKHSKLSAKGKHLKKAKAKLQMYPLAESTAPVKTKKKKVEAGGSKKGLDYTAKASKKKSTNTKRQHREQTYDPGLPDIGDEKTQFGSKNTVKPLTLTPLSSIWTTREPTGENDHVKNEEEAVPKPKLAYTLDLLWDEKLFTDEDPGATPAADALTTATLASSERGVGKRQVRSVQQSQIRQSMMSGNLDPHTMVQCETYLPKGGAAVVDTSNNRSRGATPQVEAPFEVVVHPDAVFVCDLHSHLATCEIIGFLGGRWDEATRTIHIQAAFPCRSLEIEGDDGSTDVEMDPESEIELREIIQNAELEVVGWYHSHPAFAPDPSIRDIENQTSYQALFQRRKDLGAGKWEVTEPFVGLIVGTYDSRRDSPVGLFRYFHTRGERVNSGMRQEVHMPYELVPRKRFYRVVLEDERRENIIRSSETKALVAANGDPSDVDRKEPFDSAIKSEVASSSGVRAKKRKLSTDIVHAAPGERAPPQSAKKRRGRPPKLALHTPELSPIDAIPESDIHSMDPAKDVNGLLMPEVVDLISGASQVHSSSNTHHLASETSDSFQLSRMPVGTTQDGMGVIAPRPAPVVSEIKSVSPTHYSDIIRIEESSQSDLKKPEQTSGVLDVEEVEEVKQLTPANHPEEIVIGSSQSQEDKTNSEVATIQQDLIDYRHPKNMQITIQNDDLVAASASSSSVSDSSFSYDASQSQTLTQSQSLSQGDASTSAFMDEEDPYASIEIIPSSEPSPSSWSSTSNQEAQSRSSTQPNTGDIKLSCGKDSTSSHESDVGRVLQDDEVVGDSAPENAFESANLPEGDTKIRDDAVVGQSPLEEDSGRSSAGSGGGSTPVDASMVTGGRRRTRKPSLTMRRSGLDAPSTTEQTNVSPGPGGGMKGPETTNVRSEDDRMVASSVDGVWEGVEVIAEEHVPSGPEVKTEPEVIMNFTVANQVISPVQRTEENDVQTSADADASTPAISSPDRFVVKKEIEADQEQKTLESDKAKSVPASEDEGKTRTSGARASSRRRKSVDLANDDEDLLGSLVEPLEHYTLDQLRKAVARSGLMSGVAPEVRGKKSNIMIAIREMWDRERNQQPDVVEAAEEPGLDFESRKVVTAVQSDETEEEHILFETKRVLDDLVAAVVAMTSGEIVKTEVSSSRALTVATTSHQPIPNDTMGGLPIPPTTIKDEPTSESKPVTLHELHALHLNSLRSNYGPGIFGCTEQIITLIDYYRDFHRRTDLNELWKARITKADKIEASLREDVKQVNLPVALRDAFIQDVMGYLRTSWKLSSVAMK